MNELPHHVTRQRSFKHRSVEVYEQVRADIISMRLEPGATLSESMICRMTGASRTPVREAIIRLERENLLIVKPQQGTFVAPIYLEQVIEGHFIRESLEISAMKKAAKNWQPEHTLQARHFLQQQIEALEKQDFKQCFYWDTQFHNLLFSVAELAGVAYFVQQSQVHLDRVRILTAPHEGHMQKVILEHKDIIDALEENDSSKAVKALKYHLNTVHKTLKRLMRENKNFFYQSTDIS